MDGIDACLAEIQFKQTHYGIGIEKANIIETTTIYYPDRLSQKLFSLIQQPDHCQLKTICELNFDIATVFADAVKQLQQKIKYPIDAIASHGQTVFHQPPSNNTNGCTLQLGDISVIAQITGLKTIGNFRTADMAQGGQGAPLVPFADELLFRHAKINRAVHNLGGISNTTILPSYESAEPIFAFDTGPANCLINSLMMHYYQLPFDTNGDIAQSGCVNLPLLTELLAIPYLLQPPPKSTGRELFSEALLQRYFYAGEFQALGPADKIATATAFTAYSIQQAYTNFVLNIFPVTEIIFGGGGTQNNYLMTLLQQLFETSGIAFKTHADFGIPNQYKEALAFAMLGYAHLVGIHANIPSCTGANKAVLLGQVASTS